MPFLISILLSILALSSAISAAPAAVQTQTVSYGPLQSADPAQSMDIYQPTGFPGKRPGVLLIHGGGWQAGDKSFYKALGERLAAEGFVAFSLNYRFAPKFHHPAQVDDVQRAVRWVRAHAATYALDPTRLGALGDSAGGHLSIILGTRDTRDNSDRSLAAYSSRVQCVVDFYGPTDLTGMTPQEPPTDSSRLGAQLLTDFIGASPAQSPAAYRDASPLFSVSAQSAPMLIVHGLDDPLVLPAQSERLYDALQAVHVEAILALLYKQGHGFLQPASVPVFDGLIHDFLARHLHP